MARMSARYPGTCAVCGRRFNAGANIDYDRETRSASHAACAESPAATEPVPITVSLGSGDTDDIPAVGRTFRHRQHGLLTVVRSRSRYYREDGWSFGVGDESGYAYTLACRPATDAEAAPVLAAEARAVAVRQARARVEQIAKQIMAARERPERAGLGGERLIGDRTIYGSGEWFVIEEGEVGIWYCRGNGMDGDDWSQSNMPGTIGWRVPFDADLAAELRALHVTLRGE